MQLTVRDFLKLNTQKCYELTSLNFWDQENEINEDFSLLKDDEFVKLCDLLSSCKLLSRLDLLDNNLGNLSIERIEKLSTCIADYENLQILDLSSNNFKMLDLSSLITLAKCLSKSINLTTIMLNNNQLGNLGSDKLQAFFDNLSIMNLTRLDLSCNNLGSNNSLAIFLHSKILKYPSLKALDLSENDLSEHYQGLNYLFSRSNQIAFLNLSNNNLGSIKEINTRAEYFLFYNNYNLEELDVSNNGLGNSIEVFNFIILQAKNVKKLNLDYNQLNLLEDKLNFSVCNRIETLILSYNDFSLIKSSTFNCLVKYFATSNTLKNLELENTNLPCLMEDDLNNLFEGLINNSNLITLNLAENKLAFIKSLWKFSDLLKQNKLIKLNLRGNLLGDLTGENTEYFFSGLSVSFNLKVLNISDNNLQKFNVDLLAKLLQALKNCCNLEKLYLGDQDFGEALSLKLSPLFETLGALPNLTKLNLNYIWTDFLASEENTLILSKFIQTTTSLKVLKLDYCLLETEKKIKEILSAKPSIKLKLI